MSRFLNNPVSSAIVRRCVLTVVLVATSALGAGVGCRGEKSANPPVHLNLNMDFQAKFITQTENKFFKDRRATRMPLLGTIARGELKEDDHFYRGRINGELAATLPMPLTKEMLERGHDRFNVYCRPCHGGAGDGKGMVATRGMIIPPTSYFEPRLQSVPVGHFFDVISNGVRNMPPLRAQIPHADRWAIAAFVRTLQRSHAATQDQVPPEELAKIPRSAP